MIDELTTESKTKDTNTKDKGMDRKEVIDRHSR